MTTDAPATAAGLHGPDLPTRHTARVRRDGLGTAGLTVWDWLMLVGFGLGLLLADECRKAIVRRLRPRLPAN